MGGNPISVAGLAGSLRTGSHNRALLAACIELAPPELTIEPFDLRGVPLYDRDLEERGLPASVTSLRTAIASADALLIVTPEYNAGMPAVTKNAVDWASRRPAPTPLDGKPTLVMGATPGRLGTTRAQQQLRGSLAHAGAIVLPRPQVFVAGASEKLVDGALVDDETRERVVTALAAFAAFVNRPQSIDWLGVKVGIVVPFSWSFWGAVVEHAELQAAALRRLGMDVRLIMGNDPPGQFTRILHPRVGRHGTPPPEVIPIGRSVIVPANGSLPNVILSPRSILRVRRVLARERFDLLHLHEPMTPTPCIAALAFWDGPTVATHHASGDLGWMRLATPVWGFLEERVDRRLAVSEQARMSARRWLPGEYEIVPNGVLIPDDIEPGGREHRVIFAGRHEQRKGLHVLLRAWPEIRRRTGARLRVAGADPLAVRLLLTRLRVLDDGIDVLGFLTQEDLTAELASAKALVAPSLGGESFGMVLTRAFACATPVVASDISGYRDVMTPETSVPVTPGDPFALAQAVCALVEDEPRRLALGTAARAHAIEHYSWDDIARRLAVIYEDAVGGSTRAIAA